MPAVFDAFITTWCSNPVLYTYFINPCKLLILATALVLKVFNSSSVRLPSSMMYVLMTPFYVISSNSP